MMDNDNNKISGPSLGSAGSLFDALRSDHLRGNLFGGLTAALIALPMALACGVAQGAGPEASMNPTTCATAV